MWGRSPNLPVLAGLAICPTASFHLWNADSSCPSSPAPQQLVNFRVTRWKSHAADRCPRAEQRLDRLGRAPVSPIRIDARTHGQSQGGASLAIGDIDRRPALN